MAGIPDDPTRKHPEKPGEFPSKSVNGNVRGAHEEAKSAKSDGQRAKVNKRPDEKEKPASKH